jgi:hypothetical protein
MGEIWRLGSQIPDIDAAKPRTMEVAIPGNRRIKPQTMPRIIPRFHGQTVATGRQRPHPPAADTRNSYFKILRTSPCEACANRSSFVHKESQP